MNDAALDIVKRILIAHQQPPIDDMERLIAFAEADSVLAGELIAGASEVLAADPDSLVPCWLALIAGEVGPEAGELLVASVGTSEGEALDATILPVLARHACRFYDAITTAIEMAAPEEHEYRRALYGVLFAVPLVDHEGLRDRLATFVAGRLEAEGRLAEGHRAVDALRPLADGLDGWASGRSAPAGVSGLAEVVNQDWRHTAREIGARYGNAADVPASGRVTGAEV